MPPDWPGYPSGPRRASRGARRGLPGRTRRRRHPHAGRPVPRRLARPASSPTRSCSPLSSAGGTGRPSRCTVVYGPCPRCGGPTSALPGESPRPCLDCASQAPSDDDDGRAAQAEAGVGGERLREAAHRYLEDGLLPVPAWAARQSRRVLLPARRGLRPARASTPGRYAAAPGRGITRPGGAWPGLRRRRDRPAVRRRRPVRGREPDGRHPGRDDGRRRRRRRRRPGRRQRGWPGSWGTCRRPWRTAPRTAGT